MRRTIRVLRFWLVPAKSDGPGRELTVGVGLPAPEDVAPVRPGVKWCDVRQADAVLVAGERYLVASISLADCDPPPPPGPHRPVVHSGREWLQTGETMPRHFLPPEPPPGWLMPAG